MSIMLIVSIEIQLAHKEAKICYQLTPIFDVQCISVNSTVYKFKFNRCEVYLVNGHKAVAQWTESCIRYERETWVDAILEKSMKLSGKVKLLNPYETASVVTLLTSFTRFLKLMDDFKMYKWTTQCGKALENFVNFIGNKLRGAIYCSLKRICYMKS